MTAEEAAVTAASLIALKVAAAARAADEEAERASGLHPLRAA